MSATTYTVIKILRGKYCPEWAQYGKDMTQADVAQLGNGLMQSLQEDDPDNFSTQYVTDAKTCFAAPAFGTWSTPLASQREVDEALFYLYYIILRTLQLSGSHRARTNGEYDLYVTNTKLYRCFTY